MFFLRRIAPFVLALIAALLTMWPAHAIEIETVLIGDAGNPADNRAMSDGTSGYGAVAYEYRIGKFEITNNQYVEFLRAIATQSDPHEVYELSLGSAYYGGITRSGGPSNFTYTVKSNMGNKPVSHVTLPNAMRFANWLHNAQPSGGQTAQTTEDGAYTLAGPGLPLRNPTATWFIPSDDEWHKAAYYDPRTTANGGPPGNYWSYATRSFVAPTAATANSVGDISNPGFNVVNYLSNANWNGSAPFGNVTTVGSAGSLGTSYYGTFDQAGNIPEWNDTPAVPGSAYRTARGGGFNENATFTSATYRNWCLGCYTGLRIASVLDPPGPSDPVLPGDYNDDGTVNATDYVVWRKHLGSTSITLPNDTTPGSVMQVDYNVWRENFGEVGGAGFAAAIPEPAALALAILGMTCLLSQNSSRRRRRPATHRS
jgi:formylglycine-generating enzyme required for sulfatase activity